MLMNFLNDMFAFFDQKEIAYAIMRSYLSLPEAMNSGDIDMVVRYTDIGTLLSYLQRKDVLITSIEHHVGILHLYIYLSEDTQVQLDLTYELHHFGVPYLDVDAVLGRRIRYKNFYAVSAQDEYIFNLIPHIFHLGILKDKYKQRQAVLYAQAATEIDDLLADIFGPTKSRKQRRFFWRKRHALTKMMRHYRHELSKYIFQPYVQTVVFLGPDGAGKSTLLESLWNKNISLTKTRAQTHLKPQYWLRKRNQSRGVVIDPHGEEPRSPWISTVKMLIYVQEYWIDYVRNPHRISHLKIFDRYMHDTHIDPRRYRITKETLFLPFLIECAPKPTVFIVLDADPEIIQARKSEVTLEGTRKQCASYLEFAQKNKDRCIIIDANQSAENVLSDTLQALVCFLSARSYRQLRSEYSF